MTPIPNDIENTLDDGYATDEEIYEEGFYTNLWNVVNRSINDLDDESEDDDKTECSFMALYELETGGSPYDVSEFEEMPSVADLLDPETEFATDFDFQAQFDDPNPQ